MSEKRATWNCEVSDASGIIDIVVCRSLSMAIYEADKAARRCRAGGDTVTRIEGGYRVGSCGRIAVTCRVVGYPWVMD